MIKIASTIHNHTTFCDGRNTPSEMIEKAIALGYTDFGISVHSKAVFDKSTLNVSEEDYISAINKLKEVYKGKLRVSVGVELDYHTSLLHREAYDYVIGAVHYLGKANSPIDISSESLLNIVDTQYNGNIIALIRDYYKELCDGTVFHKPNVIAHFDLITKFNEGGILFDEQSSEYRDIVENALEICTKTNAIFEVNTGAIARGYRSTPYPSNWILSRLLELGARVILSADCHDINFIDFKLDYAVKILLELGYKKITVYENYNFIDRDINI